MQVSPDTIPSRDGKENRDHHAKLETLSSLIEVSILVNSSLNLDEVLQLVMQKAQTVMNAEASAVMLLNEDTGYLEFEAAFGEVGNKVQETIRLKPGEGIAGWVAKTGEGIIVPDVQNDPRFARKVDAQTGFSTRSILAVPLKVRDKIIGVAEVINRKDGHSFTDSDLEVFSTFGRQVALALENARMHRKILKQQRFEHELEAARIIQESFLPQGPPESSGSKFEIAAKSIAATSIGGDFFDFVEFENDTIGFVIGDVSGKGIPAALYMARLVSDFRFQTQIERFQPGVFANINDALVQRGRRGMFVTMQYIVFDPVRGHLSVVSGGHLPLAHFQKSTNSCTFVSVDSGPPLGILSGIGYKQRELNLEPGDAIICITDGIIEAKNKSGKQFSFKALEKVLESPWQSAEEIVDTIVKKVGQFSKGTAQHDDLTVVALKFNGFE